MSDPFIGEIRMTGFNFPPNGWASCDGQILQINSNTALFSLFGTQYGGNGETTFALPDLRGRAPIHQGQGPGLSNRQIGSKGGLQSVALTTAQLPPHSHPLPSTSAVGDQTSPNGNFPATANDGESNYASAPDGATGTNANGNTGSGQTHENMPPFLTIHFSVALTGIFPSQS